MNYKLTPSAHKLLSDNGLEGKNKIEVFNSSPNGFVIGLGMSKKEAIDLGIIEIVPINPLHDLCKNNAYIPIEWIRKHLTDEQFIDWNEKSQGSTCSEYGIYSSDVQKYIRITGI